MKRKLFGCSFFLMLLSIVCSVSVFAYTLDTYKLDTKAASYSWGDRLQGLSSSMKTAWEQGADAWYTSSVHADFFYSASSVNKLNAYYAPTDPYICDAYGYMQKYRAPNNVNVGRFEGALNVDMPNLTVPSVWKSVAVHEFGHLIGITDLRSGIAVMNNNRDRASISVPQSDDIAGVNASYPYRNEEIQ